MDYTIEFILEKDNYENKFFLVVKKSMFKDYLKYYYEIREITKFTKSNMSELVKELMVNYNAQLDESYEFYFINENDGKKAIDYLESLRIMNKLME